jgi:TonB family protein
LDINVRTGYVTSARILQSTGHEILDKAALDAFRQWRFKPHTISAVQIPLRFSLGGTNYGQLSGLVPTYPREAREKGLTGRCVVGAKIDPRTGYVTSSSVLKSSGYDVLDRAAVEAVQHWHFRPQSKTSAEIAISFTPKGVVF